MLTLALAERMVEEQGLRPKVAASLLHPRAEHLGREHPGQHQQPAQHASHTATLVTHQHFSQILDPPLSWPLLFSTPSIPSTPSGGGPPPQGLSSSCLMVASILDMEMLGSSTMASRRVKAATFVSCSTTEKNSTATPHWILPYFKPGSKTFLS